MSGLSEGSGGVADPLDLVEGRLPVGARQRPGQGGAGDAVLMDLVDTEQVFRDVVEGVNDHDDTGGEVVPHRSVQPAEYEHYNHHHGDLVHPRGLRLTPPGLREQDLY